MKTILIMIAMFVTGCSGSGLSAGSINTKLGVCSQYQVVGTWSYGGTDPDSMTLNADCTGTAVRCQTTFTWEAFGADRVRVTTLTGNGAQGCHEVGTVDCSVLADAYTMELGCPTRGVLTYNR